MVSVNFTLYQASSDLFQICNMASNYITILWGRSGSSSLRSHSSANAKSHFFACTYISCYLGLISNFMDWVNIRSCSKEDLASAKWQTTSDLFQACSMERITTSSRCEESWCFLFTKGSTAQISSLNKYLHFSQRYISSLHPAIIYVPSHLRICLQHGLSENQLHHHGLKISV